MDDEQGGRGYLLLPECRQEEVVIVCGLVCPLLRQCKGAVVIPWAPGVECPPGTRCPVETSYELP